MADTIPVKRLPASGDPTSLAEFATGDTLALTHGGTGSTTASGARTNLELGATDAVTFGDLTCDSLTSTGIDDNATGERLEVGDTSIDVGTAGADYTIRKADGTQELFVSGGSGASAGANIRLYGESATNADDAEFRASGNTWGQWDESAGSLTFSTGTGTKTAALTIDSNQVVQLDVGQLKFPATQNASSDANTLDDYEEGTWTPVVWDNTLSDGEGQTYTIQSGSYTKIGSKVFLEGRIVMSSLGTLTTTERVRIGGLPFTSVNNASNRGTFIAGTGASLALTTAGGNVSGMVINNGVYYDLYEWSGTSGVSPLDISELTASGELRFSAEYTASA